MITIVYDPNEKEYPGENNSLSPTDGEINYYADKIESVINGISQALIITNFLLIMELRARIVEKKIDWQKIQFKFNDEIIKHDKDARFEFWPKGFGDHWEGTLHRILNWLA